MADIEETPQAVEGAESGSGDAVAKARPRWPKVLVGVVAALLLIAGACYAGFRAYMDGIEENLAGNAEDAAAIDEALGKVDFSGDADFSEPFYALVLGSDQRDDEPSRSDVMILARCDAENGVVSLLSLPRDLMVELEDYGTCKINAAYAYGGVPLAIETVEDVTGVDIDHYVEVHFNELESVIDGLGGLDIDVPVSNDETGSTSSKFDFAEGKTHMNGEEALSFVRERYGYNRGDFQRADNQRLVAMAIVKAVLDRPIYEMPDMLSKVSQTISTDMSIKELLTLSSIVKNNADLTFYSAITPCDSEYVYGGWYDILDEDAFGEMMVLMDAGEDISEMESGDSSGSKVKGETVKMDGDGDADESGD